MSWWHLGRSSVVEGARSMISRWCATRLRGASQRREEQFRHLVQNAPDVIMILDADSTVRYVNPSVERVLGYRPEDFVGTNISQHLHKGEARRIFSEGVASELENPSSTLSPVRLQMRHADGSWRCLEAVGVDLLEDPQVGGMVLYAHDVTGRRALEEELAHRAFHDPLTDLPNRALFMDRLGHALARAVRNKETVAVLFLDLDDFKEINDGLGHDAGDELLVMVGRRLQTCLRPEDTVARLGGDEFGVLLHNAKDAARVAERIMEVLRAPTTLDGHTLSVTASIGIAGSSSRQDRDKDLLRAADTAMYRAKESGKARWEVSSQLRTQRRSDASS